MEDEAHSIDNRTKWPDLCINKMWDNSLLQVAQKGPAGLLGGLLYGSAYGIRMDAFFQFDKVERPTGNKASEIPRNEAYIEVRRNDEG